MEKPFSDEQLLKLQQYLAPLGVIRQRPLFEGYGFSVDGCVFCMAVSGQFYLRGCEKSHDCVFRNQTPRLKLKRRGRDLLLNYYLIGESLWADPQKLLAISALSLDAARNEKRQKCLHRRIRDLPNMTVQLEKLLWEVGITDIPALHACGAKNAWLKLRSIRKNLSVRVLFALEGAIQGRHEAALSEEVRDSLLKWYQEQMAVRNKRKPDSQ